MRGKIANVFVLGLICAGSILLSVAPSVAQSDDKDSLAQDFKAYQARCEPANSAPPNPSPSCVNEKAQLVDRQHKLNLSDADLAALLKGPPSRLLH